MPFESFRHLHSYDVGLAPVSCFWSDVSTELSQFLSMTVPKTLPVFLLNELPFLGILKLERRILLAGITAAKKLVATRWKPPSSLTKTQWFLTLTDILNLELATLYFLCKCVYLCLVKLCGFFKIFS